MNKFLVVLLILIIQISSKVVHYHYHFGLGKRDRTAWAQKEKEYLQKLDDYNQCSEKCFETYKDESLETRHKTCKIECPYPRKN